MKYLKYFLLVTVFAGVGFIGWACSEKTSDPQPPTNQQTGSASTKVFFSEKLTIGTDQYESQLIQHHNGSANVYWQLVKARGTSRGTIVYSLPYTGVDWTGEKVDQRWAADSSALTGYWGADVDAPLYSATSSKPIFYQQIKKEDIPIAGLGFAYNGYDVLFVYGRFYAGRFGIDYVNDVVDAVSWLKSKNPSEQIGLIGMSLGGFISAQAAKKITSSDLKATVLISPLLSWPQQDTFLQNLHTLISDSIKLQGFLDFFEPYTRRFSNVESKLDTPKYSVPTLLIHDEWDTLVPIARSDAFQQLNASDVTYIKHFHSTPIDYNTMEREHYQKGSGQNTENVQPFYLAFFFNRVTPNMDTKYLLYTPTSMDKLFAEMHTQSQEGKDIVGFKKGLLEMCRPQFTMFDTTQTAAPEPALDYLTRKLNQIWGLHESSASICAYLQNQSL